MGRLVAAVLLTCVLSSVSAGEPEPGTPTNSNTSKQQTRESESAQTEKLLTDGQRRPKEEDYVAAIEAFTQAIEIDDQNGLAYRERAWAHMLAAGYKLKGSDTTFIPKVFSEAAASEVENISDSNQDPRLRNPVEQSASAPLTSALADLDIAMRLDESDAEACKLKGKCLYMLGKYSDALAAFDAAIRQVSDDPDSFYARGKAHEVQGKHKQAIADYTRAITLNPTFCQVTSLNLA